MKHKPRFIIIAWPEDHDEDLAEHARDIQDSMDMLQMGCPKVIAPVPEDTHHQLNEMMGLCHAEIFG